MNSSITFLVIPAYEPDIRLIELLKETAAAADYKIIVVNDGSSQDFDPIFLESSKYATILKHVENKGKGAALKTAFNYILANFSDECTIVTADSDGQHKIKDILSVEKAALLHRDCLVLGTRRFSGSIPFRSRFGNTVTNMVFKMAATVKLNDTQTGLRAFSGRHLPLMAAIEGNRYEYETNVLLRWADHRFPFYEEPIASVYIGNNKASHFHPLRDSFLIYKEILKFTSSSLLSFVADYGLYTLLLAITSTLPLTISVTVSNITARLMSGALNYTLNRKFVFKSKESIRRTALQYFLLALTILLLNTVLLNVFIHTIIQNRYIAKIVVEMLLFVFSITIQKHIIFRKKKPEAQLPLHEKVRISE